MDYVRETKRSFYATLGAGRWIADTARERANALNDTWRNRENWATRAGEVYDDLVERGEKAIGRAESTLRRQRKNVVGAARRVPGVAPLEGEIGGLTATEDEPPLEGYDRLTAAQIADKLPHLSQRELHRVEGYEAQHQGRTTVFEKIDSLRGAEPWAGYDEMNVEEITKRLSSLSTAQLDEVGKYEQRHKDRSTLQDAITRAANQRSEAR